VFVDTPSSIETHVLHNKFWFLERPVSIILRHIHSLAPKPNDIGTTIPSCVPKTAEMTIKPPALFKAKIVQGELGLAEVKFTVVLRQQYSLSSEAKDVRTSGASNVKSKAKMLVYMPSSSICLGAEVAEHELRLPKRSIAIVNRHINALTAKTDNVLCTSAGDICEETGGVPVPSFVVAKILDDLDCGEFGTDPDDSDTIDAESNNISDPNAFGWC
jgi:hypothetical protein